MANLPESPTWENGIYQKEITDPVLGGVNGIANTAEKQLANRTSYLKAQAEAAGLGIAKQFSGNLATLKDSGFFIVRSEATNKPVTGNGFCIVVGQPETPVAGGGNAFGTEFYSQTYITGGGLIYTRTYSGGSPLSGWIKQQAAAAVESHFDNIVGRIDQFKSGSEPNGYLPCDGTARLQNQYPKLFAVLGYDFGGTSPFFNLPDLTEHTGVTAYFEFYIKY